MFEVMALGTSAATPSVERGLPSFAIRRNGDIFLLDCGEGTQRQLMRFGLSYMKVKAIFLTHLHLDHWLGALGLVETMRLNNRAEKLTVYGPKGISAFFAPKPFLEITEADDRLFVDFGDFSVAAFPARHSREALGFVFEEKARRRFYEEKAKALGIRGPMFSEISRKGSLKVGAKTIRLRDVTYEQKGKKLAYTGDTLPCAQTAKAAKGADLLIHEATFAEDKKEEAKEAQHSTAAQAAAIAKKAGVKMLLLTHISGRYRDTSLMLSEARKAFPNTRIAEDGMKIEV